MNTETNPIPRGGKRVLVATGLYAPDIGGPATYTAFLERHLPSRGVVLTVLPFGVVRPYPRILRHLVYALMIMWKGRTCDVIYALDTVSVGVPALIASMLIRKPLYLRVPGDYAWEQGQQRSGLTVTLDEYLELKERPLLVRLLAVLQRVVASHATRIIVPSQYMKTVVARWGVDTSKVVVIYSAYHPTQVETTRDELRARFKYDGLVITTSARLVPWKGIEVLIDAVRDIRESGVLIRLEIFGDGNLFEYLRDHIAKCHAGEYVTMHGKLESALLKEHIKASDIFVLNTSYEGLSHQLLEVMDLGVPIITTPVGGNVEIITHGEEGLLVPFNTKEALMNAILTLRHDRALGVRLVERARKKITLFTEARVVHDIVRIFL